MLIKMNTCELIELNQKHMDAWAYQNPVSDKPGPWAHQTYQTTK